MTFDELASRFQNVKSGAPNPGRGIVRQANCKCPVHGDRVNSLQLAEFKDGKLGVFCQACGKGKTQEILSRVGLTIADLFPEKKQTDSKPRRFIEAEYEYFGCPDTDRLIKVKYRWTDGRKEFRWKHLKSGEWIWNASGLRIPLYGIRSLKDSEIVVLVEGEKDADTLIRLGYSTVSLPHGAKNGELRWDDLWNDSFKEKRIYIVPDNDEIGKGFALLEAKKLQDIARNVYLLDLKEIWPEIPEKADISDLVSAFGDEEAVRRFSELCSSAVPLAAGSQIQKPAGSVLDQFQPILEELRKARPENERDYNDQMMGRLFARIFGRGLRFNVTAKDWFWFNGRFWEADPGGMIAAQKAKELTDALLVYAAEADNREFSKFAVRYGSLAKRKTMLEDARSESFVSNSDFDRGERFYNCQNGVLDLTSFQFLPHEPDQLLSRISNVIYDPDATSDLWIRTVNEVMCGRQELILYLQKLFGLTLTTDTSLEKLFLLYGPTTRNGKSTLIETLSFMHGGSAGYALTMAPETLAQRKKDSRAASGDIARLNGCRFLNAPEPPKRMLFDSALVKQLTGRDTVVARQLFEREFEFVPQFKLLINTNHLPRIQDATLFESDRIVVIPFDRHFTPEEQDPFLKDRLREPENLSGIFNWCLEGLRLFRETGLDEPEELRNATESYREHSDKIAQFLEEELEKTGKNSAAGIVYQRFASWCDANGYGTDSKRSFFEELRNKGLFSEYGLVSGMSIRNVVKGYELIPD